MVRQVLRWGTSGLLLALLAFLLMPTMSAAAQARPAPVRHTEVTHVTAYAVPYASIGRGRYAVIHVFARVTIRDNRTGGLLVYQWKRSRGLGETSYEVKILRPGQREVFLTDTILIRHGFNQGLNSDKLLILRPNRIASNPAFFVLYWIR